MAQSNKVKDGLEKVRDNIDLEIKELTHFITTLTNKYKHLVDTLFTY